MGLPPPSANPKGNKGKVSRTRAQVIHDLQKTTATQSQTISDQQNTIEELKQKLMENGMGATLGDRGIPSYADRTMNGPDAISPYQPSKSTRPQSEPFTREGSAKDLVQISTNRVDSKAMILTEDIITMWNTIIDTKIKINTLQDEIVVKSERLFKLRSYRDDIEFDHNWRFTDDYKERTFGDIPESQLADEHDELLHFCKALLNQVDTFKDNVNDLIGKFSESIEEALRMRGLRQPKEDDHWLDELKKSIDAKWSKSVSKAKEDGTGIA